MEKSGIMMTFPGEDGPRLVDTSYVTCGKCNNGWFVIHSTEHQPNCCCYCGNKFTWYESGDGTNRWVNGQKMHLPGEPPEPKD